MGYRSDNERNRLWRKWLLQHQAALSGCGLPLLILRDEERWWDFLENGFLEHHHDPGGFSIEDLSATEKKRLRKFLETKLAPEDRQWARILSQL